MSQERFWVLLSKKLSGEASASELSDLEALIISHPEWQYAIQNLQDIWLHEPGKDTLQEEDAYLLHLHRMKELGLPFDEPPVTIPAGQSVSRTRKWYWMAAATLVSLAVAGFMLLGSGRKTVADQVAKENEISTRRGSRTRVQLPDGTVVMLNAGSKLTYQKDFGKDLREVTLTGEGFFDVQKMKDKPFIIHTTGLDIKVLGTVFNVKAYPDDSQTETSLIHGKIEVTMTNRPNDKIILSDNEKLLVFNDKEGDESDREIRQRIQKIPLVSVKKLTYQPDDTIAIETSWVHNKLSFKDELFADVARQLSRWYDVTFEFENKERQNQLVYGTFTSESLHEAMEALAFSFEFKYRLEGKKVIIY